MFAALPAPDLLSVIASGPSIHVETLFPGTAGVDGLRGLVETSLEWLRGAVETARGWPGIGLIAIYSFLIAFILPFPSEVVLAPAGSMQLGLPTSAVLVLIVVVSGIGKAGGSLFAFHIGQEAKKSGPVIRFLRESRFEIVSWSENTAVSLAKQYGYLGLALALSVPFFPDTISIYAFAVLEEDYRKFALATFAGSVGRLLVTLGLAGGVLALLP